MNLEFIAAVRADKLVGRGTCASIDECYDDTELWECIKDATSPAQAIELARDDEELYLEQGLNTRWGEDDDPQLSSYNRFMAARKEQKNETT